MSGIGRKWKELGEVSDNGSKWDELGEVTGIEWLWEQAGRIVGSERKLVALGASGTNWGM